MVGGGGGGGGGGALSRPGRFTQLYAVHRATPPVGACLVNFELTPSEIGDANDDVGIRFQRGFRDGDGRVDIFFAPRPCDLVVGFFADMPIIMCKRQSL